MILVSTVQAYYARNTFNKYSSDVIVSHGMQIVSAGIEGCIKASSCWTLTKRCGDSATVDVHIHDIPCRKLFD